MPCLSTLDSARNDDEARARRHQATSPFPHNRHRHRETRNRHPTSARCRRRRQTHPSDRRSGPCRLTRLGRQFGSKEIVDCAAGILDHRKRLGRAPLVDQRRRSDMDGFDLIEGNGCRADRSSFGTPSPRHRKHIAAHPRHGARTRAWSGASLRVAWRRSTLDASAWSAIDAAEQIGRDAADKPRRSAQPRHADGDVEAGSPGNRHGRITSVDGSDGQEINQRISATQQHGLSFSFQLRRSMRPLHRIAAFAIQFSHQSMNPSLGPVEVGHSRRGRFAQPADRRHRGHGLADRSARLSPRPRPAWQRRAGPAPAFREPQRSGPSYPP